ncbi:unnamed protein product [Trichogramma brassicae]|uniref:Tc1-like transposase DDE domain-containing protein n=1 Tax=Trichogramma brassicae TaxID=86971 RepID=A0A6H5IY00_9HYME|nr:unnamed protein product [Trichogramma brassicae]
MDQFVPDDNNLGVIRGLMEVGYSNVEIAAQVGCSIKTAWKWTSRLRNGVPMQDLRPNNGKRPKLSDEHIGAVVHHLTENPFSSVKAYHENENLNCHYKTLLHNIRTRTNLRHCRPAKKPELRIQDHVARLLYAQQNIGCTADMWRRTVFIDEKTFSSTKDGRTGVWRPIGTRFDAPYLVESAISGRHSIAFCGYMTGFGHAGLFEVDRRFTSIQYVDMLDNYIYPDLLEIFPDDDEIFIIQDNSPIHTGGPVREWFDEHPNLTKLNHPSRSPDLNVIEGLWAELTREWLPQEIRTPARMRAKLNESWTALLNRPEYFANLAISMTRRLAKVIEVDVIQHVNVLDRREATVNFKKSSVSEPGHVSAKRDRMMTSADGRLNQIWRIKSGPNRTPDACPPYTDKTQFIIRININNIKLIINYRQ